MDLQNDFTAVNNLDPKSRSQTLHILDKYSKIAAPEMPASEESSFAQGDVKKVNGGGGGFNKRIRNEKNYDQK